MVQQFMILVLLASACNAQDPMTMTDQKNPLLCDIETGKCELPDHGHGTSAATHTAGQKPVTGIYYTDPICSACWGIEPQLRRLKAEYGDAIHIEYRMGGLLKDWSYNSGGISKPADVAHHWDEVSAHYDMPIDGDVWLEDPLDSSYPPSIAFKAAQIQDEEKALQFLRRIREMVFLEKKNITKWEHLESAAKAVGLNAGRLKQDYEGQAKKLFQEDLELGQQLGARGFPTLFLTNAKGEQQLINGARPYPVFEGALLNLLPNATKFDYPKSMDALFDQFPTLTVKEFSVLSGASRQEAEDLLDKAVSQKELSVLRTKHGNLYSR